MPAGASKQRYRNWLAHEVEGRAEGAAATYAPSARRIASEAPRGPAAAPAAGPPVGRERPELRASLVASQIVGLAMARHVVGLTRLATATHAELIAALAAVFDHYLTGHLAPTEQLRGRRHSVRAATRSCGCGWVRS
jgi:hypothetical protein